MITTGKLIKDNLELIRKLIRESSERANRLPADVKILAATKRQSIEKLRCLLELNLNIFGENYLQEALPKKVEFEKSKVHWHFIGAVQKNKCKQLAGNFELIHGMDSLSALAELEKRGLSDSPQKFLLQVNVSGETSKSGIQEEQFAEFFDFILKCKNIQLCGFMTMPPIAEVAEASRKYFAQLKGLQLKYIPRLKGTVHHLDELSMGTSQDFEVAIQEGATIVRLGSILLGKRE